MRILVIGGCNVDIAVKLNGTAKEGTSNIADMDVHIGGVGRNIAKNLRNMGCEVTFITSAGDDMLSGCILEGLKRDGLNAKLIRKKSTGVYIAVLNEAGSLSYGYNDMKGIEGISFSDVMECIPDFKTFDGAVMDANLSRDTIESLSEYLKTQGISYGIETVSTEKCMRAANSIKGAAFIKPNRNEAELLTGQSCRTLNDTEKCAEILHSMGCSNIIISLGSEGFYFYNGSYGKHFERERGEVVDVTGAGDALFSPAFLGILKGINPEKICLAARRSAALTCASREAVSFNITPEIFDLEG